MPENHYRDGHGGERRYPQNIPYFNRGPAWGPQIRVPMYPDDADKGYWNTRLIRPAQSINWLNRAGTRWFDPIAPMLKTPYVSTKGGPQRGGWWVARPRSVPQYHRSGFTQPHPPGPLDIQQMRAYGENFAGIRGLLSGFSNLFGGR